MSAITTTPATINTNAARRIAAYSNGKPLSTVLESYNARKSSYADITTKVDATNSRVVPSVHPINGKFTFLDQEKGLHYRPTRHAYSQLSQKFKIGISTILKLEASESPEYHACLQNLIKIHFESEAENKNFLFRLNDSDNSCRALLSDKYAIVNNSWMLDQIQKYLPVDAQSHVVTDLSTEDYLSFSVFIPSSEAVMDDSNYGGLIKFTNSEIGTHRLTLEAGILRLVCTNGMIGLRGQTGLNVVHRGSIDLRHIQSLIQSGIQDHMAAMPKMIEGFQKTKHFTLGNDGATMTPLFASVAQAYKLTQLEIYLPVDAQSHVVTDLSTEDYLSFSVFIPSSEAVMDDSNYGGLIKFTNSEIGTHRLTLEAGILRLVCTNGMIGLRGQTGLNVVHRGSIDLRHIQSLIQSGIQDHMAAMPKMIEGFQKTKHFTLGNDGATMTPLFASVAQAYKLTQLEIEATHTGWGIERNETPQYARTLFGIANSITRGSQRLPEISNTKMNEIGGELGQFSQSEWIGLLNKANALQVKDCESILGKDLIFA